MAGCKPFAEAGKGWPMWSRSNLTLAFLSTLSFAQDKQLQISYSATAPAQSPAAKPGASDIQIDESAEQLLISAVGFARPRAA